VIVLDASVLVAFFEPEDEHHERALDVLQRGAREPWGASVVTLAELFVGPARRSHADLARAVAAVRRIGVAEIALPAEAATLLALLRAGTGLPMPDCCVLAAAETHEASVATFDRRLAACATGRGIEVHAQSA
jgi:predicted nucleic acid-binding protein